MEYEIIVVGGGHAGCEAALACAKKNHKTLLITTNKKNIADMPCNPSIGGSAKGIVVREIDALGGQMGKVADKAQLQMKMLNYKKGPAVKALRAQADKITYPKEMIKLLEHQKNLDLMETTVINLIVNNNKIEGVIIDSNKEIKCLAVILTTGTYMKSNILLGNTRTESGPHGEKTSKDLSDCLKKLGFKIIRLKTGTPPRIDKKSIDFKMLQEEKGDNVYHTFSFDYNANYDIEKQIPCHLTYTNKKTHQIIKDNIKKSSMYGGLSDIKSIGPRYCPSIEDKVIRFSDKERHQIFLEPESLFYDDIYVQGFSTSMPVDIQEQMVKSIVGLENAKIIKNAYAIEYDAIYPTILKQSLETKLIENLYTAGQINGTSGYEEAACQGLIAGINASLKLEKQEPLILKRSDAYIGVLIDDLITKGIIDPYRLLTSRAEYRLLLRHDNADLRLREKGYKIGLIEKKQYDKLLLKKEQIKELIQFLQKERINPTKKINEFLSKNNSSTIKDSIRLYELLKRPEMNLKLMNEIVPINFNQYIIEQVEIFVKYEGYIIKAQKEAEKIIKLENKKIPNNINYDNINNIASEARQKLKEIRPSSIGQALRISGVNPTDISLLMIYLKKGQNE
ncbi:MAG: tRNA uridine-5-carboxymethylaminomethyl(34) synthesis enzyme MnmG [Bacilli bacterium]